MPRAMAAVPLTIHTETVTAVKTNGPFNTTTGFTAKTVGTYEWTAASPAM